MEVEDSLIGLGCSGWFYKEWEKIFYPPGTKSKLGYYSSVFSTAEIDSTFYSYPSRGMVFGWIRSTGQGFQFSAKLPRVITHEKMLDLKKGPEEDLQRFLGLMSPLRDLGRLGVLLIQLPPSLAADYSLLEDFLKTLPSDYRFSCEFRHSSWMDPGTRRITTRARRILEDHRVSMTIVDEPLLPYDPTVTADHAFIRWHGHGRRPWYNYYYEPRELQPWKARLEEIGSKVRDLFGYFNNHFHGYAVANCLQMLEITGAITPRQREVLGNVSAQIEGATSLLYFEESTLEFRKVLANLTDERTLKRGFGIPDSEVAGLSILPTRVEARIRGYQTVVDLGGRSILHGCGDWERRAPKKEFCKHLAKLFFLLPTDRSKSLLEELLREREAWTFSVLR